MATTFASPYFHVEPEIDSEMDLCGLLQTMNLDSGWVAKKPEGLQRSRSLDSSTTLNRQGRRTRCGHVRKPELSVRHIRILNLYQRRTLAMRMLIPPIRPSPARKLPNHRRGLSRDLVLASRSSRSFSPMARTGFVRKGI